MELIWSNYDGTPAPTFPSLAQNLLVRFILSLAPAAFVETYVFDGYDWDFEAEGVCGVNVVRGRRCAVTQVFLCADQLWMRNFAPDEPRLIPGWRTGLQGYQRFELANPAGWGLLEKLLHA